MLSRSDLGRRDGSSPSACYRVAAFGLWPAPAPRADGLLEGYRALRGARQAVWPGGWVRRPARKAAHQVRIGDQPQDSEGARTDDPAIAARTGERGNSVMVARSAPNGCFRATRKAAPGRYVKLYIATPMHSSQLGIVVLRRTTLTPMARRVRGRRFLYIVTASPRIA